MKAEPKKGFKVGMLPVSKKSFPSPKNQTFHSTSLPFTALDDSLRPNNIR